MKRRKWWKNIPKTWEPTSAASPRGVYLGDPDGLYEDDERPRISGFTVDQRAKRHEPQPVSLSLGAFNGHRASLADLQALSESEARDWFLNLRWKGGEAACPYCGAEKIYEYRSRRVYKCGVCSKQFTETTRTFFSSRKLPFRTILLSLAILKNGSNPHRLSNEVAITYKTACAFAKKINSVIKLPPAPPLRYHSVHDNLYPFVIAPNYTTDRLILAVHEAVPKTIPWQLRGDICQDLIVAILSGEIDFSELKDNVRGFVTRTFSLFPTRYGAISLDAPPPWMGTDGRGHGRGLSLSEMLDSEIEHW